MKEFIEIIKKLWANKRTRSLAILILYVIFFVVVFNMIGNSSKTPVITKPLDNLKTMYVTKMEFTGDYNFIVENDNVIYNDTTYNINERPVELQNIDISLFTTNNIYNLINNSILESTNYVDNSNTYLIKAKDFEKIIYSKEIESESSIRITLSEKDIKNINIDLKDYLGYEVKIEVRS